MKIFSHLKGPILFSLLWLYQKCLKNKKRAIIILGISFLLLGAFSPNSWGQSALIVTSINPAEGYNNAETEITISGADFVEGAKVSLFGNPTLAGSYNTPDDALCVYVDGNYAYVAAADSGLQIINISDPQNPTLAGSYDTSGRAYGVCVVGDYIYVADYTSGLQIIDISDAQNPTLSGSYDTDGRASWVYVDGDYAYVADGDSGLQIINISDPQNPSLAGNYDTTDYARGVYVVGNYAYVAANDSGLLIIDISDPQNPTLAGSYVTPDYARGAYIVGDYAYVAADDSGLLIIDISDPQNPSLVGSYDTLDEALRVYVVGNYAYVAADDYGLQIIDISDPQNPSLAGSYVTQNWAYGVYVIGDYAYVAGRYPGDGDSGLQIIQISYPLIDTSVLDPQTISATIPSGMSEGIYDVIATNPDGQEGILAAGFEVKQYHAPVIEKVNDKNVLEGKPVTIKVAVGQTAKLTPTITDKNADETLSVTYSGWMTTNEKATNYDDLGTHSVIITVTDSYGLTDSVTLIIEVGIIPVVTSIDPAGVYNNEETAITISGANFANGAEVSLSGNPTLVGSLGSYDSPGYGKTSDVYVLENYAYVADGAGLTILDISAPQTPTLEGSYNTPDRAMGVFVLGDYAYVAGSGRQGLNLAGESPAVSIARFRYVAIPQFV